MGRLSAMLNSPFSKGEKDGRDDEVSTREMAPAGTEAVKLKDTRCF